MNFFGKPTYVGVDLGSHTLKAIQMQRTGETWKVAKIATAPTPQGLIKDGVVLQPDELGEALKEMLKEHGIHATSAHIAAAGGSVFIRPIVFPKMSESTLRKSIRFEAGRYVPGSVDDSFVEFDILGPVDDTRMNVLIVAAPKDIVQSRMHACEAAGLEVEGVDVETFAIYRALLETDVNFIPENEVVAIIDLGANSTTMSVVDHGVFTMSRSVPYGGSTLTDALMQYFKLAAEDAESGKSQLDLRELVEPKTDRENPPLRVLQPHVDDLIREIRRSLNYFQSQQAEVGSDRQVERLVLAGGGAKLGGLAEYVQNRLGLPTTASGVFDMPRFIAPGFVEDSGLDLAVASGLAMRPFAKAA